MKDDQYCDIEKFISRFKSMKYQFLNGKCFWFAFILKTLFNGEIWYSQIDNHFVCKIDNNFYDITGIVDFNKYKELKSFKEYIKDEPLDSIRLYRDCIVYIDDNTLKLSDAILFFNKI